TDRHPGHGMDRKPWELNSGLVTDCNPGTLRSECIPSQADKAQARKETTSRPEHQARFERKEREHSEERESCWRIEERLFREPPGTRRIDSIPDVAPRSPEDLKIEPEHCMMREEVEVHDQNREQNRHQRLNQEGSRKRACHDQEPNGESGDFTTAE